MNYKIIIDHHAVWSVKSIRTPILSNMIRVLEEYVVRKADANITPNNNWTAQFRAMGARNVFTYHDFLDKRANSSPLISTVRSRLPSHRFLIIAAHGGHPEELLEAEVEAVRDLDDYLLVITGRREKIGNRLARLRLPRNAIYAGYLEQADYESLKREADAALSLSIEPNTVPHAIHEFLSYGVPTIILKDKLLRSIFNGSLVEAETSDTESIRTAIKKACEDLTFRSRLLEEIDRNYESRKELHRKELLRLEQALAS